MAESERVLGVRMGKKKDAAHEPECSHVKHVCEIDHLNSLVQFAVLPYQRTVDWNVEESVVCKVQLRRVEYGA